MGNCANSSPSFSGFHSLALAPCSSPFPPPHPSPHLSPSMFAEGGLAPSLSPSSLFPKDQGRLNLWGTISSHQCPFACLFIPPPFPLFIHYYLHLLTSICHNGGLSTLIPALLMAWIRLNTTSRCDLFSMHPFVSVTFSHPHALYFNPLLSLGQFSFTDSSFWGPKMLWKQSD